MMALRVAGEPAACWRTEGVYREGGPACPRLEAVVHCRRCEVYRQAADHARTRPIADSDDVGGDEPVVRAVGERVLVFRVASEWLAMPVSGLVEVRELSDTMRLPHCKGGGLLGLTLLRGRAIPMVDLASVLGIHSHKGEDPGQQPRLLVLEAVGGPVAIRAEAVLGTTSLTQAQKEPLPQAVSWLAEKHASAIFTWQAREVSLLDPASLASALARCLS